MGELYGADLSARAGESRLRTMAGMLDRLVELNPAPLTQAREPTGRWVLADAELEELLMAANGIDFDPKTCLASGSCWRARRPSKADRPLSDSLLLGERAPRARRRHRAPLAQGPGVW
jgi:hypothetical protein